MVPIMLINDCLMLINRDYRSANIGEGKLRCPTCALVLGCWELSHVIFLMLRKKELLAKALQIHNLTFFFIQNGPRLSFGVKIVAVL